jgi:hypothetical protein
MSTRTDTSMDELIAAARLGGRIDTLIELKNWLNQKIKDADQENETRRKEIYEHDIRTASDATN